MLQNKTCSIKEAAQLLDVTPSTLRYWEDLGLIHAERTKEGNYRQYSLRALFNASDVAFLRKMGVSIKMIEKSRSYSLTDMVGALDITKDAIEERIASLEVILKRLNHQRKLGAHALELFERGIAPAKPAAIRLAQYNPSSERQLKTLIGDIQRYAFFVRADDLDNPIEGCIDFAGSAPAFDKGEDRILLWERRKAVKEPLDFFEGAICCVGSGGEKGVMNVRDEVKKLFDLAEEQGRVPRYAIGHFLISAYWKGPKDYYRVWIACDSRPSDALSRDAR